MTRKELNDIKALLYAASQAKDIHDPVFWRSTFDDALLLYFKSFPDFELSDDEVSFDEEQEWET